VGRTGVHGKGAKVVDGSRRPGRRGDGLVRGG
jgi:hypothetical protein